MYNINDIRKEVRKIYEHYDGIRVGIAGSYANNTAREKSDIDIVIDGDSTRQEIADYAKTLFNKDVDVLWLDLLMENDKELDEFEKAVGLPINQNSVYKTVQREVIWL